MERKNVFKDNWNKVDETCPNCGQVTKRIRGLTKQNLKRLITPQFNMNEVLFTFILIMVLVLAFTYNSETKLCRDWVGSMFKGSIEQCKINCNSKCELINGIQTAGNNTYNFVMPNLTKVLNNQT